MSNQYDVLIIGGGLVGASLVCALEPLAQSHGLRIAVIEPHNIDKPRSRPPSFDARSSALSYGTKLIYDKLGLWSELEDTAALIKQVHISDSGHYGITRLDHKPEGVPALGYVIDNYLLGNVLLKRIENSRKQGIVTIYSPATVTALEPNSGTMTATICSLDKKVQTVSSSLVVLADGGKSALQKQLGIGCHVRDYDQHALIANIYVDKPHRGIAYERFSRKGPIALLPKVSPIQTASNLSRNNAYGLVWTLANDEVGEVLALNDSSFVQRLQESFGYRAGRFLQCGRRDCYALTMTLTREQVRPNLVLLGNAAHVIHPIAGQGYNLAIRDVMALANNIKTSIITGKSVGELSRLIQYAQQQEADQKRITAFCDGLIKIFSRNESWVALIRNFGLLGLDLSETLKAKFTKSAMGL
ncbi:MAG: 2-octaprenyl-6-methoxyphenyl hydroxylase [Candidatus Endonucleobacter sp. (ex Gigantidas childressi)]|nr:2-octaprenyl-6-methoxyphenyl hydroxylase [Candidatus Endonucleobacter sp. (ex Gigantidas childressi)]